MYEKVWLQRHTRSAMSYYYAPPEIELVEDQRGYPGLRARNVVRDRKRRHARAAASTAAPARWTTLRIIFDAPVARPDVDKKPSLTARAKRRQRRRRNDADAQTDDPRRPSRSSRRRAPA